MTKLTNLVREKLIKCDNRCSNSVQIKMLIFFSLRLNCSRCSFRLKRKRFNWMCFVNVFTVDSTMRQCVSSSHLCDRKCVTQNVSNENLLIHLYLNFVDVKQKRSENFTGIKFLFCLRLNTNLGG